MRWYGHAKRMEKVRHPGKYLEWQPEGRRPTGRLRKRWIDGVKKNVENSNTTRSNKRRFTGDPDEWRSLKRDQRLRDDIHLLGVW